MFTQLDPFITDFLLKPKRTDHDLTQPCTITSLWSNVNPSAGETPPSIRNCSQLQEIYLHNSQLVGVLSEDLNYLEFILISAQICLWATIYIAAENCNSILEIELCTTTCYSFCRCQVSKSSIHHCLVYNSF